MAWLCGHFAEVGLNELALFAGAGGGILGGCILGWRTVCAVEYDAYAASVLVARQNDGLLPPFPIWDDVRTFNGRAWMGRVDVVSGGFPCQDISAAGKGEGIEGEKSGLWVEMARIIDEVRPRYVFLENSPMLTVRGLGVILGDLATMGFDARWGVLGAAHVGAPHLRERMWIVAYTDACELPTSGPSKIEGWAADMHKHRISEARQLARWWEVVSEPCSLDDGVANLVDELEPFGNGQVPQCAAEAWRVLTT